MQALFERLYALLASNRPASHISSSDTPKLGRPSACKFFGKMTGSNPPRKCRGAAGDDGLEDARLVADASPTKIRSHPRAAWGVSVRFRGHFNSLALLVLTVLAFLAVSVTTRTGTSAAPSSAPTTAMSVAPIAPTTTMTVLPNAPKKKMTVPPNAPTTKMAAPLPAANSTGGGRDDQGECDMSSGRWLYDDVGYPLYKESACKFMSEQSACEKYGRTELKYQRWRWQPHGCDLPRFDAARLLEKLRGKRLAFVGDSLNRNQWVSMVCLIDTATPALHKYMSGNGSLVSFKILEYNASVDFYWSPLLVESNSDHPVHHRIADRVVRAGSIEKHARSWAGADVLVFNSYLWWRRPSMKVLRGSFEAAAAHRAAYEVTGSLRAFELSIRTWSEWLERHVDTARTRLFFTSMSPTHLHSDEWEAAAGNGNHQCYNETEPIADEGHRGGDSDPAFARAVEAEVRRLGERGVDVRVLNVTQLSESRKDAHPSVHRRQWDPPTEAQVAARARDPSSDADCIHWCLPGVPDVWNQMLYAHIMSS